MSNIPASTNFYNTNEIVAYMLAEHANHVDGYNRLNCDGLLDAALTESGVTGDVPVEFEAALKAVQISYNQEREN